MESDGKEVISIDLDEGENDPNSESAAAQSDNNNVGTSTKRPRLTRAVKELLTGNNTEFMNNFDPESSNREKRKLTRKFNLEAKKNGTMYDENGVLNVSHKDVCDCLNEDCPGCHFPCPKCRSCKCGIECRDHARHSHAKPHNEQKPCRFGATSRDESACQYLPHIIN